MTQSVAVIGVGAMGAPMAARLLDAGFRVFLCDRDEAALARFRSTSATVVASPAECAHCDVVLVLVVTAAQLRDVVLGDGGVVTGLVGRMPTIAVMSTVPPASLLELQRALAPHGVGLLDAPISGGAFRAAEGSLTIILGGGSDDVAVARPVLETLGTNILHCGPVGSAQVVKIVNNVIGSVNTLITAEAYRIAVENGLTLEVTTRVLDVSTGRNFLSSSSGDAPAAYGTWTEDRDAFDSLLAIMRKDLGLAVSLAEEAGGGFPVLTRLTALLDDLGEDTFTTWQAIAEVGGRVDRRP
jgi:3-hydroxyisobutyrate dehydrogenase